MLGFQSVSSFLFLTIKITYITHNIKSKRQEKGQCNKTFKRCGVQSGIKITTKVSSMITKGWIS